jgi:AmmeMemoRadiSam system protein A
MSPSPGAAPSLPEAEGAGLPEPVVISPEAGALLLRIARATIAAAASRNPGAADLATLLPPDLPPDLRQHRAAFVTLRERGDLRGCMGSVLPERPLWEAVVAAAVSAAQRDPRFSPVIEAELADIDLDVSVLGMPVPIADPLALRVGIDGIIVEQGRCRALLLPEVGAELGWDADRTLQAVCEKAGLASDAWRDPDARVFAFRTAKVHEGRPID